MSRLRRMKIVLAGQLTLLLAAAGSAASLRAQVAKAYTLSGEYGGTHDPSIARDGNTYYVFATGKTKMGGQFTVRCSQDLKQWTICGQVFDRISDWIQKPSPENPELYALASRVRPSQAEPAKPGFPPDWQAVEAPFIVHKNGYYFLFVSWDLCCRGVKSNYHIMVGRSRSVTGPYVDKSGKTMAEDGGSELMKADKRWLGPGGESILMQEDGPDIMVFHAYAATDGKPALQVSTISWERGWPEIAMEQ